jgi:8-amino-7-oxononanoate synthase
MNGPPLLQQLDRTYVLFKGARLAYFSGCDYYRLSSNPQVIEAAKQGLDLYGVNVGASRTTTGNHLVYEKLEAALADYFGVEKAILVSSGYATNIVAAQALQGEFTHCLFDSRAHASLKDATSFLKIPCLQFAHRSPTDLRKKVRVLDKDAKVIVLTDGMFAHDGSTAPLTSYQKALAPGSLILVDDAHAAGVLGPNGRGTSEFCGADGSKMIQTITLSKAFGAYGGAILCTRDFSRRVQSKSSLFQASTPPPFPAVCAALKSIELLKSDHSLRQRLKSNKALLSNCLRRTGVKLPRNHPGPVIGFEPTSTNQSNALRDSLLSAGIYPPLIRYPGGPESGYYRFAISSEHTRDQILALAVALEILKGPGAAT